MLTRQAHVAPSADDLYDDLGYRLMAASMAAVEQRGVFHLALSGGSTPERFYIRLVTDPRFRPIPWQQTHLWIVDERRVPEDHEKSNYRMIRETLADHVPMPARQRHPVPVSEADPAAAYERELSAVFGIPLPGVAGSTTPRLDFVLLGMGDDAHTASLFPNSPAIGVTDRWVVNNDGPSVVPPPRVTMTFPLLNAAREVAVLVTGEKKAATLQRVTEQWKTHGPNPKLMPITGIAPAADGEATLYLDAAAATGEADLG